jgi:hypothetical protein
MRWQGMGQSDGEMSRPGSFLLPRVKSKFSNAAFALVYLGQGERSLGNLLKKLGIAIHIPNLLELFFF